MANSITMGNLWNFSDLFTNSTQGSYKVLSNSSIASKVVNKSTKTVVAKIALKKVTQRIALYAATAVAVPGLGDAIALGLIVNDIYTIGKYYVDNKEEINSP